MFVESQILTIIFAPLIAYVAAALLFAAIESKGTLSQLFVGNIKSGQ
jgi:small-conductance mechanosensitive channel